MAEQQERPRRRRVRLVPLLAATLLLLLVAAPASAAGNGAQVERPYRANLTGTFTIFDEECVEDEQAMTVTCPEEAAKTGIAIHLGRTVSTSTGSVTLLLALPCGPSNLNGNVYLSVFDSTHVAANGDELYSRDVLSGCRFPGLGSTGPVGTFTITGGTGRFEGAAGSGDIVETFDDGSISSNWSGTLTY